MANDGNISTGNGAFQRTVMVSAQPISTFTPLIMGLEVEPMDLSSESHRIRLAIMPINRTMGLLEWDTANTASFCIGCGDHLQRGNVTLTRTRAHHE